MKTKEKFEMSADGTITQWETPKGTELLFLQSIMQGSMPKIWGGGAVCQPIVHTSLKNGGTAYDSDLFPAYKPSQHTGPFIDADGYTTVLLEFENPSSYSVSIKAKLVDPDTLEHLIILRNGTVGIELMPFTLDFLPHFVTNQKDYQVRFRDMVINDAHMQGDRPYFLSTPGRAIVSLDLSHGIVTTEITAGYTHLCLWSKHPRDYVCVAPMLINDNNKSNWYLRLKPYQEITCGCTLSYHPYSH